jgi:nucleoside-diphosphate-sugar epimerase
MVLASDIARILPTMAGIEGIFHLTDGYHPSILELETALALAMGRPIPWRLPKWAATLAARIGDCMQSYARIDPPLDTQRLEKMVRSLTFSDQRARSRLGWNPRPVLQNVSELL